MPDFTRKLTILSCLLFTGFCFWKAALGLVDVTDASVVSTAEAAMSPSFSHKRGITTPIQDMRPGMRIVGRNPNRIETESVIDPTPEGWRLLSVRMLKQDGSYFEAELLRPLGWIHQHRAKPGATIQLNMPELRVVGAAEVLSISDCPSIDPGDGPVVLSTFKNVSRNVLNIYVEGEETPIGEKLRSALGRTVRITSIEIRAGPEAVYNLEVAGEHVYSITDSGLLVHNTGPCDELVALYSYTDKKIIKTGSFESKTGCVYLSKHAPGDWLTDRGVWASLKRVNYTGRWKAYDENTLTIFTTGSIKPAEWGLKPISPCIIRFWKHFGGQYHNSIGTSGFKLNGSVLIDEKYTGALLINEPIMASSYKYSKALVGLGADYLGEGILFGRTSYISLVYLFGG